MYTLYNNPEYDGTYLSITNEIENEQDVTFKIRDFMRAIPNTNHKDKEYIYKYFNTPNVIFRIKKKFIKINFDKLEEAIKLNKSNIIYDLDEDFKKISEIAIHCTNIEPLMLDFPIIKNAPIDSYFIKTEEKQTYNKAFTQKQIAIALERLHKISTSLNDEYTIFFIQELFNCKQLETLINKFNYKLNYNLIIDNFENLNPYAFEDMEKEMIHKLIKNEILSNSSYVPKNKFIGINDGDRYTVSEDEATMRIKDLKNIILTNLDAHILNAYSPFYNKTIARIALKNLFDFLDSPKTKMLLKNGELIINDKALINSFACINKFDYKFLSFAIDMRFNILELKQYYDFTKIENLSKEL